MKIQLHFLRQVLLFSGIALTTDALATPQEGTYFLASEFLAYMAFLFALPLLIAFAAQALFFSKCGVKRPLIGPRALASYAATTLGSLALAVVFLVTEPLSLGRSLGVRELPFAGMHWPIMPLAFLVVAVVAPAIVWWGVRRENRPNPSINTDAAR